MKIVMISNDEAIWFLKRNRASKEVVFYRPQDRWIGIYKGMALVAVGGYSIKKNTAHIGGVFVKKEERGQGLGNLLVDVIIASMRDLEILLGRDIGKVVSYSRPIMAHILDKKGFKTIQVLRNGTKKQTGGIK